LNGVTVDFNVEGIGAKGESSLANGESVVANGLSVVSIVDGIIEKV